MTGAGAPSLSPGPLWRGRALAVLGILLCAFSLRSAVASLSPVIHQISADFPLPSAVLGLIGTLPPMCFAVFGLITPILERRFGIERLTVVALIAIAAGLILRGFVGEATGLVLATALIFAGVGMGNILMPPLVKKYFPDRIGLMMTLYTTAMACSTFLPPLIAVPVADALGWRFSLTMWAAFAVAGVLPWLVMLMRGRRPEWVADPVEASPAPEWVADPVEASPAPERVAEPVEASPVPEWVAEPVEASPAPEWVAEPVEASPAGPSEHPAFSATGPIATAPGSRRLFGRLARIPLVWALSVAFGTSSIMAYVSFAWFPVIMVDVAGVSESVAGLLLSLFAVVGLPSSLLVPVLVVRFHATRPLFLIGALGGAVGILGLLLFPLPGLLWVWTLLFGLVGLLFPLALVLISIRSRTPESAVLLSSFVQSVGYVLAAIFPTLVGVLHGMTAGWTVPLLVLVGVLIASIPAGMLAGRRRTVEDEWERRHGAW